MIELKGRGVLDAPLEPSSGLPSRAGAEHDGIARGGVGTA